MEYTVLKNSEVKTDNITFRLDAEYFKKEYLDVLRQVESNNYSYMDDVTEWITQGPNPIFSESGIPCLTGRNINNGEVSYVNPDYVDDTEYQKLSRYQIKAGDTLVTLKGKGSIGKIGYVTNNQNAIFSRDIGIVRPTSINAGYLNVFILCKYGKKLIDRGETGGTGQSTLTTNYLKSVPVPRFNIEDSIGNILENSELKRNKSKEKYQEAQSLLLSEIGFLDWKPKHRLSFVKDFSDTQSADRIDAEYYQPMYEEMISKFKSHSACKNLEEITTLVGHPSNPPYAEEESKDKTFVITQKHLGTYFPNDNFWEDIEALYTTREFIRKNKQYLLQAEDIILYSVGAYIGKANIYNSSIPATIGSFLTLIRPDRSKINPYYLLVFLNSDVGKELTRRCSRGMAQQYVYPFDIRKFVIPIIGDSKQNEIESKMTEALETKTLSKHLLEIAKRGVEMAIEKSEKDAQGWIDEELKKLKNSGVGIII